MPSKQLHIGTLRTFQVDTIEVHVGQINRLAQKAPAPYELSVSAQMPAGYHIELKLGFEVEAERNAAFAAFDQARAELFTTGPLSRFLSI